MRLSSAVLGTEQGPHSQSSAPMVDIRGAGQMGMAPDYRAYISAASYVRRNLFCVVMESPRGFDDLPQPEIWHDTFKALFETGAQSIEGLRSTIRVETASQPIGGSGEQFEDPVNVTRERSEPTFTFVEKYGKPINRFLDGWIRFLIMDPETKVPAIRALRDDITDLLPDYYAASLFFIEPDPLHMHVVESYLMTNCYPETAGTVEGRRDISQSMEQVTYNVRMFGMQQVGAGVNALAQTILDQINLTGANPNTREAFLSGISANAQAASQGYRDGVNKISEGQI